MRRTRHNGDWKNHPETQLEIHHHRGAGGRPTKFYETLSKEEVAYRLCLLGATDADLADAFGVSESTINSWKHDHPEFLESIRQGKDLADARTVESLHRRANGYEHPEDKVMVVDGEIHTVRVTKHYPPDTRACEYWLNNRRRGAWRSVQHVEGDMRHAVVSLDLSDLTDDELIHASKLGLLQEERRMRQVTDGNDGSDSGGAH